MSFLSPFYLPLFLPCTVFVYFLLKPNGNQLALVWLIAASLLFYGLTDLNFLPLLLFSVVFNYLVGIKTYANKPLLFFGIVANIFLLSFFKYPVVHKAFGIMDVAFPLGVSFYTLRQIAFLVDCFEGRIKKKSWIDYLTFILFFPHLTIGPLSHFNAIVPQFHDPLKKTPELSNVVTGAFLLFSGLFKKVFLVGLFQPYVDRAFGVPESLSIIQGWLASISFTIQLYFDFSGYSDMAIGSALVMNIVLPENFNSPLKARSLIEFWSRWHISLTRFLTTYVYSPILYFSRRPTFGLSLVAVFTTFAVSGLWHGGNLTYITFGLMHAIGLTANHIWRRSKVPLNTYIAWAFTFIFVVVTNTIFRSAKIHDGLTLISTLFGWSQNSALPFTHTDFLQLLQTTFALLFLLVMKNSSQYGKQVGQWVRRYIR